MTTRNWRCWGYDGKLLGEVCSDTLGGAMRLARSVWPDKLAGDRLFDCVPGHMVNDPLVRLIQDASKAKNK